MKFSRAIIFAWLILALAGLAWWSTMDGRKNPEALPASTRKTAERHRPAEHHPKPTGIPHMPPAADNSAPGQSIEPLLQQIHDASVTYDPKELVTIRPFLTHPDPGVRKAAVDGMIVLGDASAGAMLREASKSLQDPKEAVTMLEAADYVELPSASQIVRKKKRSPGVREKQMGGRNPHDRPHK